MKDEIKFKKVSEFERGLLCQMLKDAYSFNKNYEKYCLKDWREFDNFFFDNLNIADKYGFVTTLNDSPIGLVSWDPRNRPEYVEVGHNCIISKYKGKGYGKLQMSEAIKRILEYDNKKIIVCTDEILLPAQKMYEAVGFIKVASFPRPNEFNKDKIEYSIITKEYCFFKSQIFLAKFLGMSSTITSTAYMCFF